MASEEVLRRCDVETIGNRIRSSGLRWFGNVKRVGEESTIWRATMMEVAGTRPLRRPKRSLRKCIDEDLVEHRDEWRRVIARPTPLGKQGR